MNEQFIHVLVEGETEELFFQNTLSPILEAYQIYGSVSLVTTKKDKKHGKQYKGGDVKYARVKKEVESLLNNSSLHLVTTIIDYSGFDLGELPQDNLPTDLYPRVKEIEKRMQADIGNSRFLPFLMIHEFEALLFSDTATVAQKLAQGDDLKEYLDAILKDHNDNPEAINHNTTPFNRLFSKVTDYQKIIDGNRITQAIGLDTLRARCQHFNQWLTRLMEQV